LAICHRQSPNAPPSLALVGRVLRNAPRLPTGATKLSRGVARYHSAIPSLRIRVAAFYSKESMPANHCATLAARCGERALPPLQNPGQSC
jgi:hypothetical protein